MLRSNWNLPKRHVRMLIASRYESDKKQKTPRIQGRLHYMIKFLLLYIFSQFDLMADFEPQLKLNSSVIPIQTFGDSHGAIA